MGLMLRTEGTMPCHQVPLDLTISCCAYLALAEHLGAGTLPYMAPELLVSARVGTAAIPATNRVDIYSMAMIMWEMLAGRVPWSHSPEPMMLAAVRVLLLACSDYECHTRHLNQPISCSVLIAVVADCAVYQHEVTKTQTSTSTRVSRFQATSNVYLMLRSPSMYVWQQMETTLGRCSSQCHGRLQLVHYQLRHHKTYASTKQTTSATQGENVIDCCQMYCGMLLQVMSGRRPELPMENVGPITQPLSEIPASLNALPEFNAIIRACWNQREHRRPTAATLHEMLLALLQKYEE